MDTQGPHTIAVESADQDLGEKGSSNPHLLASHRAFRQDKILYIKIQNLE